MASPSPDTSDADTPQAEHRRGFLAKATVIVFGSLALAVPSAIGLFTWLKSPFRQKSQGGDFKLAMLAELPEDGTPRKIPVIADRNDAWNRFPAEPIGAVFLRRAAKDTVEAFQAKCPHAGCLIQYVPAASKEDSSEDKDPSQLGKFFCACHAASFGIGGERLDSPSPSPRDMDSLEADVNDKGEVWVKFVAFKTGCSKKEAKA